MDILTFKEKIHLGCVEYVQQRIETALQAIASVQAAGEEENKSSAGDKYETGREMMKQEIQRHQQLLIEAKQMLHILESLPASPPRRKTVGSGSLVQTDQGLFYLAIGIGKLSVEGQEVFVLSSSSPVGKLLIGKCEGDVFSFNTRTYQLLDIQ